MSSFFNFFFLIVKSEYFTVQLSIMRNIDLMFLCLGIGVVAFVGAHYFRYKALEESNSR
jgi:hypothetical protein